jgi:hypothetical protein
METSTKSMFSGVVAKRRSFAQRERETERNRERETREEER